MKATLKNFGTSKLIPTTVDSVVVVVVIDVVTIVGVVVATTRQRLINIPCSLVFLHFNITRKC